MRMGLRELRRKPGRFGVAGASLVLLTILLLFLGGLLDGLFLGSTGALRAQPGSLITYSSNSRLSVLRSRIDPATRATIEGVDGVARTGGVGVTLVGATGPGSTEPVSVAVIGYQDPPRDVPAPPPTGQAWADRRLQSDGVEVGQTLSVGPGRVPVTVAGWVDDASFLLQGGLWVDETTWRSVLTTARPDQVLPEGTFQVLTITTDPGADPTAVATAIDAATGGTTATVTRDDAVLALPGVREQRGTFTAVIGVTLLVAGLVVALFFALATLERTAMYGVFKAIGASSRQVFAGVATQAVVITIVSFAIGGALTVLLARGASGAVPISIQVSRIVGIGVSLLIMAVLGAAISLRRVVRIDPASAIG